MKTRARIAAALATLALVAGTAAPAQAHYDPWTTHNHCNSFGCYTACSVWDKLWGCRDVYYIIWRR